MAIDPQRLARIRARLLAAAALAAPAGCSSERTVNEPPIQINAPPDTTAAPDASAPTPEHPLNNPPIAINPPPDGSTTPPAPPATAGSVTPPPVEPGPPVHINTPPKDPGKIGPATAPRRPVPVHINTPAQGPE